MIKDRIGVGIYIFIQQLGDHPDFKTIVAETLNKVDCKNLEFFFPMENSDGVPEIEFAKKELDEWIEIGQQYNLRFPSAYINYVYHSGLVSEHAETIDQIMAYAAKVMPDLKVFVSNPVPLNWNDPTVQKTDEQLRIQLEEAKVMADIMAKNDQSFSYHFHEAELKDNAREMLFMMRNSSRDQLSLTLDANWCLNGGYDPVKVIEEFGDRINNLHLRSSTQKVWDTILNDGEEKNIHLLEMMKRLDYQGNYIIEISDSPGVSYDMSLEKRLDLSITNLKNWLT